MSDPSPDIANLLAQHIASSGDRKMKKEKKAKKEKKPKKDKKQHGIKPPKKGKLNIFQMLSSDANLRHTLLKILGGTVLVGGAAAAGGVAIHHYYNSASGPQQVVRPSSNNPTPLPQHAPPQQQAYGYGQPPPQHQQQPPPANYGYGYGCEGRSPHGVGYNGSLSQPPTAAGMASAPYPPQQQGRGNRDYGGAPPNNLVYGQGDGGTVPPIGGEMPMYGSGGGGHVVPPPIAPLGGAVPTSMNPLVYGSASHGAVGPSTHPPQPQPPVPHGDTMRVDPSDSSPATITMIANDPRVASALAMLSQQGFKVKGGKGFGKKGRPSSASSSSSSSSSDSSDSDSD